MGIVDIERAKYERVWALPEYRQVCHSLKLWEEHREWFPAEFALAVDLGCGLGLLFGLWNDQGIDAWGVDLAGNSLDPGVHKYGHKVIHASLWEITLPRCFDLGVCTDVMEHIPPDYVVITLESIARLCSEVLFKVAHGPTNDLGGSPLHLTLQPVDWWINQMKNIGGEAEFLGPVNRSGYIDSVIRWKPSVLHN